MQCTASDLHVAIYSWNIDVINQCVMNKNIINSFWRGCTPVSSAIYLKRYNILQILVNNGASVNLCSRNDKMEPPLFAACRIRDYNAINILLNAPSLEIDQRDFFGRTALWAAARYGSADIVELLLNRGATLNTSDKCCKKHPINGALQQNKKSARNVIQLLVRRGSLLDAVCEESPLKWAIKYADRETFCLLVSAGCKVRCGDWLSYENLPKAWQEDEEFCKEIDYLKKNPSSLLNLSAWIIRSILVNKWNSLSSQHVQKLNLPLPLCQLLLFQN